MATVHSRLKSNLIILLAIVAVVLLLGNVRIFQIGSLLNFASRYWPLVLIGVGVVTLFSGKSRDFNRALYFTSAGVLLQIAVLGWLPSDVWQYWPIMCIVLGIWLLFVQPKNVTRSVTIDSPVMKYSATLQGASISVTSGHFSGGEIYARMAMVECDFAEAVPAQVALSLSVHAKAGSLSIGIPDSWHVTTDVSTTLAAYRDERIAGNPPLMKDSPVLHISGSVLLGSLAVRDGAQGAVGEE